MKLLILFELFLVVFGSDIDMEWHQFKMEHKKLYSSEKEDLRRYQIFKNNLQLINDHNKRYESGETSYYLGVNEFADMTLPEIQYRSGFTKAKSLAPRIFSPKDTILPKFVDWRSRGVVAPVKIQGQCGSCWAFSAVASIESRVAQQTGSLVELSEQNLIDCSQKYGNNGCEGGQPNRAFEYIIDNKGIDTESSYPYQHKDYPCRFKKSEVGAMISSYANVSSGDELALQGAVFEGVVSAGIEALMTFYFYSGGIYDDEGDCHKPALLNHGINLVGYGTQKGKDYWIVRNSLGHYWGEKGYIRIARHKNVCGIADLASYPIPVFKSPAK